jgi:hypothetical protein
MNMMMNMPMTTNNAAMNMTTDAMHQGQGSSSNMGMGM